MKQMGNLLISEPPLQVLPSLAVRVGLKEAIVLQQFHYWLQRSGNNRDGYKWVYNSYDEWHKQFPFFSKVTLRRTINSLEKQGYLVSGNYNKAGFDKTKWYRIDYQRLNKACDQNDHTRCSNCSHAGDQNEQTNTNRLPETTTETTKDNSAANAAPEFPWQSVIDYLNEKTGKHFKHTNTNKGLVMARQHDGFSAEDMQKVIDHQCKLWLNTKDMAQYLRPSTLFRASKFEGYLNAVPDEPKHEGREYWTGG
ncbi:replication protein (plasmid) [Levilactobacillus brevis]|nr:replication protein [Levilactobacillus brevis]